jgi:hypothetical protein
MYRSVHDIYGGCGYLYEDRREVQKSVVIVLSKGARRMDDCELNDGHPRAEWRGEGYGNRGIIHRDGS